MGVIGGNFLGFQTTPWIDFLATFGSGPLTFLAGAEIEPESLRRHISSQHWRSARCFSQPRLVAPGCPAVRGQPGTRRLRDGMRAAVLATRGGLAELPAGNHWGGGG